jgi:hypothetical protein
LVMRERHQQGVETSRACERCSQEFRLKGIKQGRHDPRASGRPAECREQGGAGVGCDGLSDIFSDMEPGPLRAYKVNAAASVAKHFSSLSGTKSGSGKSLSNATCESSSTDRVIAQTSQLWCAVFSSIALKEGQPP